MFTSASANNGSSVPDKTSTNRRFLFWTSRDEELLNNCTWTWTSQNGNGGYLVTSNKPGYEDCSIFLPASGAQDGNSTSSVGSVGRYWTKCIYDEIPSSAWYLIFQKNYSQHNMDHTNRNYGYSIRPVCP